MGANICLERARPEGQYPGMTATCAVLLAVLSATDAPQRATHRLHFDWKVDGPVGGALLVGWVGSELAFKKTLAPTECHWCATNGFDNAVRSAFHPDGTPSAFGVSGPDTASNLVGFALLPVAVFGLDFLQAFGAGRALEDFPEDAAIILEATFAGLVLDQAVKFGVGRARPYTVGASPELLAQGRDPADHYLSFFSGHSTWAFGLATAAGTVASLRGHQKAWLTWLVGLPIAATTALLRLAADKHWATDVLVGSAVGAAFGAGLPLIFHGRMEGAPPVTVVPIPGGLALAARW